MLVGKNLYLFLKQGVFSWSVLDLGRILLHEPNSSQPPPWPAACSSFVFGPKILAVQFFFFSPMQERYPLRRLDAVHLRRSASRGCVRRCHHPTPPMSTPSRRPSPSMAAPGAQQRRWRPLLNLAPACPSAPSPRFPDLACSAAGGTHLTLELKTDASIYCVSGSRCALTRNRGPCQFRIDVVLFP